MRIVFMGSPDFSVAVLKELHQQHDIVAVYTQPPKPAGRGHKIKACPVHQAAQAMGLHVLTPKSLRNKEAQEAFIHHRADIAVVVAYGLILPKEILEAPLKGCINIHASLLPKWRGAAPIQRAIEAGDKKTGITYMQMDEGLDTGDELKKIIVPIDYDETGLSLHNKLSQKGAGHINALLADWDQIIPQPQNHEKASYAHKLSREESKINWNDTAQNIERRLRAFTTWPGLFTEYEGKRLRILKVDMEKTCHNQQPGTLLDEGLLVACGQDALRMTYLQKEGKKPMDAHSFLLGTAIKSGVML